MVWSSCDLHYILYMGIMGWKINFVNYFRCEKLFILICNQNNYLIIFEIKIVENIWNYNIWNVWNFIKTALNLEYYKIRE